MEYRNRLITFFLAMISLGANAQVEDYGRADSLSSVQFKAGNWAALKEYASATIRGGTDFPQLRLRAGYAGFYSENYSAALTHFEKVLAGDSYNQEARYQAYLCQLLLNRPTEALWHTHYLRAGADSLGYSLTSGLREAGIETGIKAPGLISRGTGSYTRAFAALPLGNRIRLGQSVSWFSQTIDALSNRQFGYYARAEIALNGSFTGIGAYHYLNSRYVQTWQNHLGVAGIRFSKPWYDVQATALFATITGSPVRQYDVRLGTFPLGNMHVYTTSKITYLDDGADTRAVFSQVAGFKAAQKLWLEVSGTFGGLNNFSEADGLYVYNAIDASKYKTGATGYFLWSDRAQIILNYTLEQKTEATTSFAYYQHSVTGGIIWKF